MGSDESNFVLGYGLWSVVVEDGKYADGDSSVVTASGFEYFLVSAG